jgi:hypothetical protein
MPTLIDHLAEEEQKLLPIVSVTLTQSEWDALGKHGMSAIPVTRRLVILGHITEQTDEAEREKFLRVVPAPRSFGLQADRPPPVHPRNHRHARLSHLSRPDKRSPLARITTNKPGVPAADDHPSSRHCPRLANPAPPMPRQPEHSDGEPDPRRRCAS